MKFIPILFSTAMVQALLADRKTQTRRATKDNGDTLIGYEYVTEAPTTPEFWKGKPSILYTGWIAKFNNLQIAMPRKCPYGEPGDILWVRESFCELVTGGPKEHRLYGYKTGLNAATLKFKWKPSIHMPKEACRLFMRVKSIRTERLHEISTEDIIAEGVQVPTNNGRPLFELTRDNGAIDFMPPGFKLDCSGTKAEEADFLFAYWAELWCSINGLDSWNVNPWVWVIEFERVEKPENFLA